MNKKLKKITSIIISVIMLSSFITITYGTGAISSFNLPSFNEIKTIIAEHNGELQNGAAYESIEPAINIPAVQEPPASMQLMNESIEKTLDGKEYTTDEVNNYKAAQLAELTEKYPEAYVLISTNDDIDPFWQVVLLEMIDYWEIDDLESYIDTFVEDGFNALEQYHTTMKKEATANE